MRTAKTITRWTTHVSGATAPGFANRRGATAVIVALCLAPLVGLLGLSVDIGMLYRERRTAQTAADAAALAGANELYRNQPDSASAAVQREATRNGFTHGSNGVTVTYNAAGPTSGYYTGKAAYVEVEVARAVPALFAGIFGQNATTVRARAVAGYPGTNPNCLYVLQTAAGSALDITLGGTLTAGCGIVVNSSNSAAVDVQSSGRITATSVAVAGGLSANAIGKITPIPQTDVPPSVNPFARFPRPPVPGCDSTSVVTVTTGSTVTLGPATYCGGIVVEPNGTANLSPGRYYLAGGLSVDGNGTLNGTGVTFVNTSLPSYPLGAYNISSNANVNLWADTTGSLAGILFYQDPTAVPQLMATIGSTAADTVRGAFYFPNATLDLRGNGNAISGAVVADRVIMSSISTLTIPAPTPATAPYYPVKRVSLVE